MSFGRPSSRLRLLLVWFLSSCNSPRWRWSRNLRRLCSSLRVTATSLKRPPSRSYSDRQMKQLHAAGLALQDRHRNLRISFCLLSRSAIFLFQVLLVQVTASFEFFFAKQFCGPCYMWWLKTRKVEVILWHMLHSIFTPATAGRPMNCDMNSCIVVYTVH